MESDLAQVSFLAAASKRQIRFGRRGTSSATKCESLSCGGVFTPAGRNGRPQNRIDPTMDRLMSR